MSTFTASRSPAAAARTRRWAEQIANFLATLGDQTLDEAIANAELDARSYGWPRHMVRELGTRIRARYTRGGR